MTSFRVASSGGVQSSNRVLDAVVTHHRDGFRSGVARFNELLAQQCGVPLLGIVELAGAPVRCPLLSFKISELTDAERAVLTALVDDTAFQYELYLHELDTSELSVKLVEGALAVRCGNDEIYESMRQVHDRVDRLWTPGLVVDTRVFKPAEITVFSFGMAHKIRVDMFQRLRSLLDASGRTHAIYVSAANHETSSMRDAQIVFEEMHALFPDTLYFLGNLSDVAVYNHLRQATFFASFFERGVRANNTSVAAALELGSIVVTNLDEHSPAEYVHLDNVLDIQQLDELPLDPLVLKRISVRGMETGRARGWERLAAQLAIRPQ